jgi:hypothetical protein
MMGAAARSQLVRSGRAPESSGDGRFAHNADAWRSPAVKKVGSRSISARATVSGSRGESRPTDRCFMVVAVAAVGALGRLPPAPPQAAAPVTREQKASDAQEELALFRCVRLVVGSPHEWTLPKPKAGGTAAHSGVQFTSTSQPRAEPAQFARLCDSLHATQHITRGPRLSRRATAIAWMRQLRAWSAPADRRRRASHLHGRRAVARRWRSLASCDLRWPGARRVQPPGLP